MKRFVALACLFVVTASFAAGCKKDDKPAAPAAPAAPTTPPADAPAK